ncbi:MAG: DUF6607 family protein [Pseudomonadota bacterium]
MRYLIEALRVSAGITAALGIAACVSPASETTLDQPAVIAEPVEKKNERFEADREAILAMAGNYLVSFDFIETVSFMDGYEPKDPYKSGAHEVVRVIEDRGDYISLQHILVVGGPDEKFPIKHWRQDWQYEPDQVLIFAGGNAWEIRDVSEQERTGKWSQTVYQVDDSPRYGAVGAWTHDLGLSEWEPPAEWRPLPRRDMTTRDDYHAVLAVNRHTITPDGWVHEQDNIKLVLSNGEAQPLVREIGFNTYSRNEDFEIAIADEYWQATADYWHGVREEWTRMETDLPEFALTLKGEPQDLYIGLLGLADQVQAKQVALEAAGTEAKALIAQFTTEELGPLTARLRPTVESGTSYVE